MAPSASGDADDARLAREIVDHARFSTERILEKMRDLFRERWIDFEERRAVRGENAVEVRRRAPDELETVLPRGHRETWLECERRALTDQMLERVIPQVGQVRDDHVDGIRDRSEQISFAQLDSVSHAIAKRVLSSDRERVNAYVGRDHVHGAFVSGDG